jgi:hypothetical protein
MLPPAANVPEQPDGPIRGPVGVVMKQARRGSAAGLLVLLAAAHSLVAGLRQALLFPLVPHLAAMLAAATASAGPSRQHAADSHGRGGEGGTGWWRGVGECTATGRQLVLRLGQAACLLSYLHSLCSPPPRQPAAHLLPQAHRTEGWTGRAGGSAWADDGRDDGPAAVEADGRGRGAAVAAWSRGCMAGIDLLLGALAAAAVSSNAAAAVAAADAAVEAHRVGLTEGVRYVTGPASLVSESWPHTPVVAAHASRGRTPLLSSPRIRQSWPHTSSPLRRAQGSVHVALGRMRYGSRRLAGMAAQSCLA